MKSIVVIGGGGHAKVLISILKKNSNYKIIGYTDLKDNGEILGVKYIGDDSYVLDNILELKIDCAVLAIGQIKDSSLRKKIAQKYQTKNIDFPVIISSQAIINENVIIGDGSVVMDGVIINPDTIIGEFSILNTGAIIEHDCSVGNFTHIAPGVIVSGGVSIGNDSLIGTGAKIINNVKLIDNIIVAAGSSIHKSVSMEGIYIGVPAKLLRDEK